MAFQCVTFSHLKISFPFSRIRKNYLTILQTQLRHSQVRQLDNFHANSHLAYGLGLMKVLLILDSMSLNRALVITVRN